MNFRENKKLKADSGDMSKLCPVTTLKEYLESTANESTRKLLLSPTNHNKPIKVQQLSSHISALIKFAEPSSKLKLKFVRFINM